MHSLRAAVGIEPENAFFSADKVVLIRKVG